MRDPAGAKSPKLRGLHTSRMNISMGIMLITLAINQIALYESSPTRRIIAIVFVLIGLYNLFAGIRNLGHFKRMTEASD